MDSYRFTNREQKNANLAILRDLLIDNVDDQPARTALTNAITMAEATIVAGELDEMIRASNRFYRRSTNWLSVFFVALALCEFAFAAWTVHDRHLWFAGLGPLIFGVVILSYILWLRKTWSIQRHYYTCLKRLEEMQLELPTIPPSLIAVN